MNENGTEPHSEVTEAQSAEEVEHSDEHGIGESHEEVHEEEVHEEKQHEVDDEGVREAEVHEEGVHDEIYEEEGHEEEGHEGEGHEEGHEEEVHENQVNEEEAHQEGESHEHELDAHSEHSPLSPSPATNDEGELTPMREKFQISSHHEEGNDIEDMVNLLEFGKSRPISIVSIPDEADVYDIPDEE